MGFQAWLDERSSSVRDPDEEEWDLGYATCGRHQYNVDYSSRPGRVSRAPGTSERDAGAGLSVERPRARQPRPARDRLPVADVLRTRPAVVQRGTRRSPPGTASHHVLPKFDDREGILPIHRAARAGRRGGLPCEGRDPASCGWRAHPGSAASRGVRTPARVHPLYAPTSIPTSGNSQLVAPPGAWGEDKRPARCGWRHGHGLRWRNGCQAAT